MLAVVVSLAGTIAFAQSSGSAIYIPKCAGCHGTNGVVVSQVMKSIGTPNAFDPRIKSLTTRQMFASVKNGKGRMPPFMNRLTDAQIIDAVAFFRDLGTPASVSTPRAQGSDQLPPSEYSALVAAGSQSDPKAKAAALESFLRTYPQSLNKKSALNLLMNTYKSGLGDDRNALSAAKRGLEVDPNDENAIFVAVEIEITECNRTGDPKVCNDAAELGQRGLSISKPSVYTDDNWRKTIAVTYPYYHSAIALARPVPPDTPKMTNNEVIQLVTAGLSDQVVITSIRQASNKDFDLSITGLIALKKAKVGDAVIAAMQESGTPMPSSAAPNQVTPESRSEASPEPTTTIATPAASPCADIDYLGVIQAVTGGGQMAGRNAYGGRVRNRAPFTKEVDFAWVMNGRAETGTFRVPAGQFIDVNLGEGSGPPTNVSVVTCR
jgi:cytochrome c5